MQNRLPKTNADAELTQTTPDPKVSENQVHNLRRVMKYWG
jgi:hypothetical protein